MKVVNSLIVLVFLLIMPALSSAQKWKDKINNLKGGGSSDSVTFESQDVIAGRWPVDSAYNTRVEDGGMMRLSSKEHVRIYKDSAGLAYKVKFMGETYTLWDPDGTDWASGFSLDHMTNMCFFENSIVRYHFNYSTKKVAGIKWVIGSGMGVSAKKIVKKVQEYLDYGLKKIAADREAIKQAEIANRKKYTLEGREVVAIRPVWKDGAQPDKLVSGDEVELGFEIDLADGTSMKTMNIGGEAYIEDLEVVFKQNVSGFWIGQSYSTGVWGGYNRNRRVAITAHSPWGLDDPIDLMLTVKSRYGGDGTATIKVPVFFGRRQSEAFRGWSGDNGRSGNPAEDGKEGHRGPDVVVELKQLKHSVTGQALHVYKIKDRQYIIEAGGHMTVQSAGGSGGAGGEGEDKHENESGMPGNGGNGGHGGNGGNITLIVDPSVTIPHDFEPVVSGGMGGSGGYKGVCWSCNADANGSGGYSGFSGSKGTFTEKQGKVSF